MICTNCTPSRNGRCENRAPSTRTTCTRSDTIQSPTQQDLGPLTAEEAESSQTATDSQLTPEFPLVMSDSAPDDLNPNHVANSVRQHVQLPMPDFQWGERDGSSFCNLISSAYSEVVHWRRNVFMVPSGKTGKSFIRELATLYQAYSDASALECIALKACTVMQCLLLQKPHAKSKAKEHAIHLERRLQLWHVGNIDVLLHEGRCIQKRLVSSKTQMFDPEKTARIFSRLMLQGKVKAALRLLSHSENKGVLSLDDLIPVEGRQNGDAVQQTTRDILLEKHPKGKPAPDGALVDTSSTNHCHDSIIFEQITGEAIRQAALHTHGAAGPSGVDAYAWRRFCSSFQGASIDLCNALATVAKRLCTVNVHPDGLDAFVACRLIPLDKNPGVRPIGIGEVPRRIIAKVVLKTVSDDVQAAAGPLQTCAGHEAGCEAAVHAMREIFAFDDTEAILLVDASNAFNSINRQAALHNIQFMCPAISTILSNTYQVPIKLFIVGEGVISSSEGTTQGDPLAMAMYSLAIKPLIDKLRNEEPNARQVWFADDATAAGKLVTLRQWWQLVTTTGPEFGYHPNASKTHLVVKPELVNEAKRIFENTNVQISTDGQRHLGAAIGTQEFIEVYAAQKVGKWLNEIKSLTAIARTHPHAAYAAFVHGVIGRWLYLMRTIDINCAIFQPLEDAINHHFIPALTGQASTAPGVRKLLSLQARFGGLNIKNPS